MAACCTSITDLGCTNYCDTFSLGTTVPTTGTYEIDIFQPTVARFFVTLTAGATFLITNTFNEDAVSLFGIKNPNGTTFTLNGADCFKIENIPAMTQGTTVPVCCTPGFVGTITGDAVTTDFVITHALNSRNVQVEVFESQGDFNQIAVDTELTSVNSTTIKFSAFAIPGVGTNYSVNVIKVA